MKKTVFALTIASLLSAPALASKEGFYIGADLASNSLDGDSFDTGVGLVAGYDFQVSPDVVIGVEGEYRHYGEDSESYLGDTAKLKAYSYGINVKPKYYFNDNFYAGAQVGLHNLEEELKLTIDGHSGKFSDNNTVLSLGVEAGYDFNRNASVKGGYKSLDSDYGSFYIGANYKF
ncbi:porin family protein [Photobacterium sp. DNB23_23_1]|uniref:Porin family protein n=1 Tax=Photobacterium pectinilyticum TaxID=2906793 RepID=A0ABT1MXJ5_9GAMM|nr:porin family protein [Photobacterium sp. ZSDE20]MCQ1057002.1 porin family protein [Photobacterium sp. ZSDE20]MDD1821137.1 porin family protein [Photobacterium sp. ZSDE20]